MHFSTDMSFCCRRTVPGNDLSALERPPEEVLDIVMGDGVPELLLHVHLPTQNFLVRETIVKSDNEHVKLP